MQQALTKRKRDLSPRIQCATMPLGDQSSPMKVELIEATRKHPDVYLGASRAVRSCSIKPRNARR